MNVNLKCSCSAVEGTAVNINAKNGSRIICCCDDCQAFAKHLGRQNSILDDFGGTDIYQTSQSQVKINKGVEHLRCVRLTKKGLIRWYTDCCNTPIGNTMSAGIPFIGVIHNFIDIQGNRELILGPILSHLQTQHAYGNPNYPNSAKKFPIGITARIIKKVILWKIKGMDKPSVFFDKAGNSITKEKIIS